MKNVPTPEDQLIERLTDPESSAYNPAISFWIGQLREWKHLSRSAATAEYDYGIYHCCRGIFEDSKSLCTVRETTAVGNAVIQEFERALPCVSEDSGALQHIEHLIQNVRSGIAQFEQETTEQNRDF